MLKKTHALFGMAVASLFFRSFRSYEYIVMTGIFAVLSDLDTVIGLRHRGFTHSLSFAFAVSLMLYVASPEGYELAWISAAIGILSHLFLDSLTRGGVPLYYPLSKKRYSLPLVAKHIRYDSLPANLFFIFISVFLIAKGVLVWNPT